MMIHTAMASNGGETLHRSGGRDRRRLRRRIPGLLAAALMAGSGAGLIAFSARAPSGDALAEASPPGPFSYFPH